MKEILVQVVQAQAPGAEPFAAGAVFRSTGREWVCGECDEPLRRRRWLGRSSEWAKDECQRQGWALTVGAEREYVPPPKLEHVACRECAQWSGQVCGVGFTPSESGRRVRICGKYTPRNGRSTTVG